MTNLDHPRHPRAEPPSPAVPVPPLVKKGLIRRAMERTWAILVFLMGWLSIIGTLLMILYQILFPWGFWLPWGWNAESAWIGGFIMAFVYIISKLPHLWGQEPGDWTGLIREVFLGMINVIMVTVFLTSVWWGMSYSPSSVGVAVMHLVVFLVLIGWQIQAAMRLTMRTWSDQTGLNV